MSAIGHNSHLSAHANYRREDYVFARTQSRQTGALDWETPTPPLHSWSEILYPALGLAGAAVALFEVLH
jgi:hypothetical protein